MFCFVVKVGGTITSEPIGFTKRKAFILRIKRLRRNKAAAHREKHPLLTDPNECWSKDFVADALFDGRRFRALTIVDNYSRECLEIEVGQSLKRENVVRVMERMRRLSEERFRKESKSITYYLQLSR